LAFSQLVFVVNVWRVIFPSPISLIESLKKEAGA
jgi:hypothetical protein